MKSYIIFQPAQYVETYIVEAESAEEAYKKYMANPGEFEQMSCDAGTTSNGDIEIYENENL